MVYLSQKLMLLVQDMGILPDVSGVASTDNGMKISFDVYKSKGEKREVMFSVLGVCKDDPHHTQALSYQ